MPKKGKKELHGNKAKIDPKKNVTSLYQTNTVTMADHNENETPIVPDENVEYARDFVNENKK